MVLRKFFERFLQTDDRRVKKVVICNLQFVVTDLFIHGALTVLGVLENSLKHVRAFQIEVEFGSVGF